MVTYHHISNFNSNTSRATCQTCYKPSLNKLDNNSMCCWVETIFNSSKK